MTVCVGDRQSDRRALPCRILDLCCYKSALQIWMTPFTCDAFTAKLCHSSAVSWAESLSADKQFG